MVQSKAATVAAYLKSLPPERRAVIAAVRKLILKNLPRGYRETMNWGGITYEVPFKLCPDTYNGQPLCYAGLAAQKHYYAVYLMCIYQDKSLAAKFRKAGKKLDMGKCCIRFKKLEDLPLPLIAKVIAAVPPKQFIAKYEASRRPRKGKNSARC